MAKRSKRSRTPKPQSATPELDPAIRARARRMIDRVRYYYDLGRQAESLGSEVRTEDLAAAAGVSRSTMRQARRFAQHYDEEELAEFLELRRPNGLPLHAGHLGHLATTLSRQERRKFQQEAAQQGWTADDLRVAIQQSFGKSNNRRSGKVKEPPTAQTGLLELVHEGKKFQTRCGGALVKVRQEDSPGELAKQAKSAAEELARVESALGEARRELEQLAERKPQPKRTTQKAKRKSVKKKGTKATKKKVAKKAPKKAKRRVTKKPSHRRR